MANTLLEQILENVRNGALLPLAAETGQESCTAAVLPSEESHQRFLAAVDEELKRLERALMGRLNQPQIIHLRNHFGSYLLQQLRRILREEFPGALRSDGNSREQCMDPLSSPSPETTEREVLHELKECAQ